jgi:hypothetical protein
MQLPLTLHAEAVMYFVAGFCLACSSGVNKLLSAFAVNAGWH